MYACAFNIMSAYINLMNASSGSCISNDMTKSNKHTRAKTVSPPKVRKDTLSLSLRSPLTRLRQKT